MRDETSTDTLASWRAAALETQRKRRADDGSGMRGERDADRRRNGRPAPRRQASGRMAVVATVRAGW